MTLYFYLIGVVLGVLLWVGTGIVGYQHGKTTATTACTAREQAAVGRAIEQANRLAAEDAAILRASAASRQRAQRDAHTRTQEAATHAAHHPDLYGQRLDACGLCLVQSAARHTDPAACPCGADAAVPAVIRAGGNDDGR